MLTKEELKNKFIRYIPKITEDVFNKIIEIAKNFNRFLSSSEYEPYNYFPNTFESFVEHKFFWFGPKEKFAYGVDNNSQKCSEIQVSDILGENWNNPEKWWKDLKSGDYVVVLTDSDEGTTYYCNSHSFYKPLINHVCKLSDYQSGCTGDGKTWKWVRLENCAHGIGTNNVRLATSEEIKMYEHAGNKPVDVTTYKIPEDELELIEGEVYITSYPEQGTYIFKATVDLENCSYININKSTIYVKESGNFREDNGFNLYKKATPEEKQWLNVCIAEGKFIEKVLALRGYDMYGKPLKSDTFILPEKWCIKGCNELTNWQKDDWNNKTNCNLGYDKYYYTSDPKLLEWDFKLDVPSGYTEITFEQFKKYVLKENNTPLKKEEDVKGKQAIIIENKEQWDFALNIIRKGKNLYELPTTYNPECMSIDDGCHCSKEYYTQEGYELLTFDEWCKQENIDNPFKTNKNIQFEVGKWYLRNTGTYIKFLKLKEGTIYSSEEIYTGKYLEGTSGWGGNPNEFKLADLSEIQQYLPDGHPDKVKSDSSWCVVVTKENREVVKKYFTDWKENEFKIGSKYGINKEGEQGYITNNGYSSCNLSIKTPVISTEEFYKKIGHTMKESEYKVGDFVYHKNNEHVYEITEINGELFKAKSGPHYDSGNLSLYYCRKATPKEIAKYEKLEKIPTSKDKPHEVNTYGLFVGMELPVEIINAWSRHGDNYYNNGCSEWKKTPSGFIRSRKITKFETIQNEVGFLVSDTYEVYLKAKGFKEFMDNYNKQKDCPCKPGDYIYIIDATKGGERHDYRIYNGDVVEVTSVNIEFIDSTKCYWIHNKPASFSGGGFRLGGSGWQWGKHVRLATSYEIEQAKSGWKVPTKEDLSCVFTTDLFKSEEKVTSKPKLKLKNKSKIKISKKQVKVSNKHLI